MQSCRQKHLRAAAAAAAQADSGSSGHQESQEQQRLESTDGAPLAPAPCEDSVPIAATLVYMLSNEQDNPDEGLIEMVLDLLKDALTPPENIGAAMGRVLQQLTCR